MGAGASCRRGAPNWTREGGSCNQAALLGRVGAVLLIFGTRKLLLSDERRSLLESVESEMVDTGSPRHIQRNTSETAQKVTLANNGEISGASSQQTSF